MTKLKLYCIVFNLDSHFNLYWLSLGFLISLTSLNLIIKFNPSLMKVIFLALLLAVYSQARITIPLEKVQIDRSGWLFLKLLNWYLLESEQSGDAAMASATARFLTQNGDSLKLNFWNQRNVRLLKGYFINSDAVLLFWKCLCGITE